jgi:hypothetical protein
LFAALDPRVRKNEFYADCAVNTALRHEQAGSDALAAALWDLTARLVSELCPEGAAAAAAAAPATAAASAARL